MSVIDQIGSLVSTVDSTLELVRSDRDPRTVIAELEEQLVEQRMATIEAKKAVAALEEEAVQLRKQQDQAQAFASQREHYELKRFPGAGAVYVAKDVEQSGDAAIYFCAHCFERRERSILQFAARHFHSDTYTCHACGARVEVPNDQSMAPMTTGVRREFSDW